MSIKKWIIEYLGINVLKNQLNSVSDEYNELRRENIRNNRNTYDYINKLHNNLTNIGVDVGFKEDSTKIIIISRLNGGQVRIIDKYLNQSELQQLLNQLERMYENKNKVVDAPRGWML